MTFHQSGKATTLGVSKAINFKDLLVTPLFFDPNPAQANSALTKKLHQRLPPAKQSLLRLT